MQRIRASHAPAIAYVLDCLPERLRDLAACDFFCADPVFAGIHAEAFDTTDDGRSYRETAHCCYPYHVKDRRITVVLPGPVDPAIILHELGHAIHGKLWKRAGTWDVAALDACTDYARTNEQETFAEAFLAWFYPPRQRDEHPYWFGYVRGNDEFFDRLLVA